MVQGNVVVLGCGLMGSSIAYDLLQSNTVSKVTVIDSSIEKLKALEFKTSRHPSNESSIGARAKVADKLELIELDVVKKKEDLQKILPRFDIGVGALPHGIAEEAVFSALEAGLGFR